MKIRLDRVPGGDLSMLRFRKSEGICRKYIQSARLIPISQDHVYADFVLNRISVRGEVSNLKYHTSGHIYFSLKDAGGTIACVMFAGMRGGLTFRLANGQQIVADGNVNVYERDGKYQLYASRIRLDGAGRAV